MRGRIHSIETMGTLDGPGIRTVFFLQGCPLKCKYCHNPDTWHFDGGTEYSVDEIVSFAKRYKMYYGEEGGVTFSGGEALMQGAFLLEAMRALKEENINIALDTSGIGQSVYYEEILSLTDTVLLDIKHFEESAFKVLTNVSMKRTYAFYDALKDFQGALWIRHVMVPNETSSYEKMDQMFSFIASLPKSIDKIEILPYHKLGSDKYSQMGLEDPLKDTPEMDSEEAMEYQLYLNRKLKTQRSIAV